MLKESVIAEIVNWKLWIGIGGFERPWYAVSATLLSRAAPRCLLSAKCPEKRSFYCAQRGPWCSSTRYCIPMPWWLHTIYSEVFSKVALSWSFIQYPGILKKYYLW